MSQDDLYAFHARVFGSTTAPPHPIPPGETAYNDQLLDYDGDQNGDDLGYYRDGAKRTLTDDQIAMFRHSEIYAILRARQVRQENREADGDQQSDDLVDYIGEAMPYEISSDEGELRSSSYIEETEPTLEDVPQNNAAVLSARAATSNKRKRENADRDDGCDRGRTSRSTRRVVRELDWVKPEDQVLDYSDEPSTAVEDCALQSKHSSKAASPDSVKGMPEALHTSQSPFSEGKKIWWPVIG